MLGYPLNRPGAFTGDFWRFGRGEIPDGRQAVFFRASLYFSGRLSVGGRAAEKFLKNAVGFPL
jgi:hypothetical protein